MNLKWVILAVAVIMYALVIVFQNRKAWFTIGAALIILSLGVLYPNRIFPLPEDILAGDDPMSERMYALLHAGSELVNWNVLMIYLGSMIIASLFIYSGVPARIADNIINRSRNTAFAIVLILAMTGIISIFVENVAAVLVMAPVALALCRKLKMDPALFIMGLAVMSNIEGTATLVGDPPSMVFASFAGFNFNDFFVHDGKLSIFFIIQVSMAVGCIFFYFFFAGTGKNKVDVEKSRVISLVPLILLVLMIAGLAAISFYETTFEYMTGSYVLGLGLLGIVWYRFLQRKTAADVKMIVKGLDWETIFMLAGIFIVVGAIQEIGLLDDLAKALTKFAGDSKFLGFFIILLVSVIISGFVDNVPYIMAMLPVASSMAASMGTSGEFYMFALLVGSCLGGNLTPYGASANVVAAGILKEEGSVIKFSGWLKICGLFTLVTTVAASLVLWIIWA